jgi:hypothetical protein
MRKRVPKYQRGDVIYADKLNQTLVQANRLDNKAHATGLGGMLTEGFEAEVGPFPVRMYLVRMKCDHQPEGYVDATEQNREEFNACIQTWDAETSRWVDAPSREIQVEPKDQLPLLEDELMLVVLQRSSGKFVPAFQEKFAWVRIPTGATVDEGGYYLGVLTEWDSDNQEWVDVREVYIRDANL